MRFTTVFAAGALAAAAALTAGCNRDTAGLDRTTSGYGYKIYTDAPGETVQPGQAGEYYISIYKGDSLIQNVRNVDPSPQRFVLPSAEEMDSLQAPNPMLDLLQLMSPGDSASVYIFLDTIEQRPPGFTAADTLRYDVALTRVMDLATFEAEEAERNEGLRRRVAAYEARQEVVADSVQTILKDYKRNPDKAGFTTTASGLKYKILEPGSGEQPEPGSSVTVDYYGVLVSDGEMFDNSFRAGKPFSFPLGMGQVIPGWDEGIALLQPRSRAVLAIPSELAYGDESRPGSPIPAGSELMFYVELAGAN